ncbi:MAG: glycosyltransferase [Phycisphaerae bacterium]|nr:glycosyltransferase [Phycisphaerae bacterium]
MTLNNINSRYCSSKKKLRICFVMNRSHFLLTDTEDNQIYSELAQDFCTTAAELAKDPSLEISFICSDYYRKKTQTIEGVKIIKGPDTSKNMLVQSVDLFRVLSKTDSDIYITSCFSALTAVCVLFARIKKKKIILRLISADKLRKLFSHAKSFLSGIVAWSICSSDMVAANTADAAEEVSRAFGHPATVIKSGLRLGQGTCMEKSTVLWYGDSKPSNNPELFIRLAAENPKQHFTMICSGSYDDSDYLSLSRRAMTLDNLWFIRNKNYQITDSHLVQTKLLVETHDSTDFSYKMLKACKSGTPILSLNANPDNFLHEHNCGYCCSGDLRRLENVFRFLISKDRYAQYFQSTTNYTKEHHDISVIAGYYKQLFSRLVNAEFENGDYNYFKQAVPSAV